MPVTQTENAGHMLSWTAPVNNTQVQEKIKQFEWLKNAQLSISENTNNGRTDMLYTAILPGSTMEQINNYRQEIESLAGVTSVKVTPMDYDVKRPLYSAALHNFFSINIDATGMSDEELQSEVQRKLKDQGVDMKIQFKTNSDGRREVSIEKSGDDRVNKDPHSFELNIDDDNGKEKLKMIQKKTDTDKFKGKTDQEIRKMVRDEFKKPDLKDSDIIITRNSDEVQVRIEVNQQEFEGPGDN
ncbi:MAG: hypothetical protein IT281_07640 [Ignavibacteria bacterium]|nr:hypothetical protein [Ignavibacteria bacterium]